MISVIIPIYNTAKWLSLCLDSVLKQDFRDIEVILVNDASTDKSLSVCKRYAAIDDRIILIDKQRNEGVELARQSGYTIARGEYVMYIDADDWLDHTQVLSNMYEKAESTGADYVEIGAQWVLDNRKWFKHSPRASRVFGLIETPELFDKYYISYFGVNILSVNMWGKLYRKTVLDHVDIEPFGLVYGEDFMYNMSLFPHLQKIYVLNEIGYNYRYGGMSCHYNPRVFEDLKRMYCMKEKSIKQYKYYKASDAVRIEMKNIFKSEICQKIEFGKENRETIITYIDKEIKRPLYSKMLKVDKTSGFWNDPFVLAFADGNSIAMYEICYRQVRKEHPKRVLKRFAAQIIQSL